MKRFVETNTWKDPWYTELSIEAKIVWKYICDNCDHAGVWETNFRLGNFLIKADIDWDGALQELGDRVEVMPNGRWHLTKFVRFQCGAYRDCPPHNAVVKLMRAHGLDADAWIHGTEPAAAPQREKRRESEELPGLKEGPAIDPLFAALCEIEGAEPKRMSASGKKRVNDALREILAADAGVTPARIKGAAKNWKKKFSVAVTAKGLASHWAALAPDQDREQKDSSPEQKAEVEKGRIRYLELTEPHEQGGRRMKDLLSGAEQKEVTQLHEELKRHGIRF